MLEKKVSFFKDMTAGRSKLLQWMATYSRIYVYHTLDLMGLLKTQICVDMKVGWVWEDLGRGDKYD